MKRAMPRPASFTLDQFLAGPDRDAILGDVQELWNQGRSRLWLYREVAMVVALSVMSEARSFKGHAFYALVVGWLLLTEFAGLAAVLAGTRPGPWFALFWSWRGRDLFEYGAIVCFSAMATGAIVSLLHGRSMVLTFAVTVVAADFWAIARYPWAHVSHTAFLVPIIAVIGLVAVPCSLVVGGLLGPQRTIRI